MSIEAENFIWDHLRPWHPESVLMETKAHVHHIYTLFSKQHEEKEGKNPEKGSQV
ncbi:hypothetical protein [Alkalicoccus halolimnae]|uniref:Uncharacterized protein n=1 Tax=Alkalicoccus halolimnae TaxID=1667239 RepID=A0AAJ8LPR2_9BACI|nr:hypothetical protein [Alkalicoccus halolimnae]